MPPLPLLFSTVRPYLQYGNIRSTTTRELGGRPVIDRRKHDLAMHQYLLAVDPGEQRAYVDPLQSEESFVARSLDERPSCAISKDGYINTSAMQIL
jgi:hypothetical protein